MKMEMVILTGRYGKVSDYGETKQRHQKGYAFKRKPQKKKEKEEMNLCTRLFVQAIGIDRLELEWGINHNLTQCTGETGNCGCIHAEEHLLSKMPNPEIVILSHSPCLNCAKLLVQAGVREVRYIKEYRIRTGIDCLKEHGIEVKKI
jgi:deoxycytidylate deaminase